MQPNEILTVSPRSHEFLRMRQQIDRLRPVILAEGVRADLIDRFAEALEKRLKWAPGTVLRWRAFRCMAG